MTNEITITDHKVTAEEVEKSCPEDLQALATKIKALIEKMDRQVEHVKDQSISVDQLLAEAKKRCDKDGFKAFHKKFLPNLGKSRFYELLQIATDKRSLKEIRAITRERVAKHRANKAASVTVTENPDRTPDPHEHPAPPDMVEDTSTQSEQVSEASKPRRAINAGDEPVSEFTTVVTRLVQISKKREPKHFAKTAVPDDELARLGNLLTGVAELKKLSTSLPRSTVGNGTISPEQSAQERKAKYAALEATA